MDLNDINKEDNGTKFYFDENDESYGSVTIKSLDAEELSKITKETTHKSYKKVMGQVIPIEDIDEKKSSKMLWDACIVSWDNVTENGEVLECNKDSKYRLMTKNVRFRTFVSNCIEDLNESIENGGLAKN